MEYSVRSLSTGPTVHVQNELGKVAGEAILNT